MFDNTTFSIETNIITEQGVKNYGITNFLCGSGLCHNFLYTWMFLNLLATIFIFVSSGSLFLIYYVNPTFEMWQRKTQAEFPTVHMVRDEILQMLKGMGTATLCPAASLWMADRGYSKAYCIEDGNFSISSLILQFMCVWIISDGFEFLYHYCGHYFSLLWKAHKPHHKFFNPSPFAVIADDFLDQLVRSSPLLWMPLIAPMNIEMMLLQFALFFYVYGIFLHWGFEFDWLDADHPIINSAYHHNLHHMISAKNQPYHCGFFFKIWDQIFGSIYKGPPFDAKTQRKEGKRTK